jgi:murein DD-endopeptidase MepM/ murein hydrolase activator NlpD
MGRPLLPLLLASALLGAGGAAVGGEQQVRPGGIVRWRADGATACAAAGRTWAPIGGACFFPVDLLATGTLRLETAVAGSKAALTVRVAPYPYPEQRLTVDDRMVHLSPEDEARAAREAEQVRPLWALEGAPRFTLPLGKPLAKLPQGGRFGARRVFNGEPRSPHSGVDYKATTGTPVLAVADGRVALAAGHFFGGNSVYVDHGGGLVTVAMHLSRMAVKQGDEVKRGQVIGAVGATGRVTGPHLHFAARWHGARVDPALLFGPVAEIPEVTIP